MSSVTIVLATSGAVIAGTYAGAYLVSTKSGWDEKRRQKVGDAVGALFALALLAFVEALFSRVRGTSFFTLLAAGSTIPAVVFVAGCVIGMAYEYFGQLALRWWHYPSIERKKFLFFVLPLFWGIFMLVMQGAWGIFRSFDFGVLAATVLTAIAPLLLIEGINVFTHSWVYTGRMKSVPAFFLGWIILTLTFVLLFNRFITNPFGL